MSDAPKGEPTAGFGWAHEESWMAQDDRVCGRVAAGSYYPDHVVFLGAALPTEINATASPACLVPGEGIQVRDSATSVQRAMLRCLSDVMRRIPGDWDLEPIGPDAEASLLNWDAEKYRQWLAAKG